MYETTTKKKKKKTELATNNSRSTREYPYFEAALEDEPTHSLPGPENDNTIKTGTFLYVSGCCLCVRRVMLPVMAFLSISVRGFT